MSVMNEVGNSAATDVTDKVGFARRWQFSKRMVDNFLAEGMPHLKFGKRRVRIVVPEADAWLREKYFTQRRKSPGRVAQVLHADNSDPVKTPRKQRKTLVSAEVA